MHSGRRRLYKGGPALVALLAPPKSPRRYFGASRRACAATATCTSGRRGRRPFDLLVRRDWRLARRPARKGCEKQREMQQSKKGCNQPVCGHNSAILQPGISHFLTLCSPVAWGSGPTNFSFPSGTHITCIRRPLAQFAVGSGSDADAGADAYPNDFHVRYARRWSLASSWMRWMRCQS